ncbi:MAG TPA: tyrosine-type recombinase/integrase [Candidatus Tumulicola sp.]
MQAQERREAGADYADTGHVFQTPLGGPVDPFLATEAFRSTRGRSKVKATLHDLRHTAATWMLAAGVDIASVARVLGHATPTTTLSIYAHAMPAAESRAVASIDERLALAKRA